METVNKQDVIINLVKEEKWTREEIIAKAGCTVNAFASYLTTMRNIAKYSGAALCPLDKTVDDKKILGVCTYAEFEAVKSAASSMSVKTPKSLAEVYQAAVKRVRKAEIAVARFDEMEKQSGKFAKATADWYRKEIAKNELALSMLLLNETPVPEPDVETPVPEPDVESESAPIESSAPADEQLL